MNTFFRSALLGFCLAAALFTGCASIGVLLCGHSETAFFDPDYPECPPSGWAILTNGPAFKWSRPQSRVSRWTDFETFLNARKCIDDAWHQYEFSRQHAHPIPIVPDRTFWYQIECKVEGSK